VVLSGKWEVGSGKWKVESGTQMRNRDPLCIFHLKRIKSRNGTSTHHSWNNIHYQVKVTAKVVALTRKRKAARKAIAKESR
jgi:hypothetical protein